MSHYNARALEIEQIRKGQTVESLREALEEMDAEQYKAYGKSVERRIAALEFAEAERDELNARVANATPDELAALVRRGQA